MGLDDYRTVSQRKDITLPNQREAFKGRIINSLNSCSMVKGPIKHIQGRSNLGRDLRNLSSYLHAVLEEVEEFAHG